MNQLAPFLKKELRSYFYSPIAYIVGGVFLGLMGYFFYASTQAFSLQSLRITAPDAVPGGFTPTNVILKGLFRSMGTVFILLTPLITMRLIAEERRTRTMELLMTSPLSLTVILAGKFLAAFLVYAIIILSTLYIPVTLAYFSTVSWGQILAAYLGLLLLGMAMIAAGVLCSAVTDKQVIAAVLTIGVLVLFWFVGGVLGGPTEAISKIMRELSIFGPFESLYRGLIDLRDIVYLLSFTALALFFAHRVLESGRWT